MPFGKYRGQPLSAIPADYLLWVLSNIRELNPITRREIEFRLGIGKAERRAPSPAASPAPVDRAMDALKGWYRKSSLRFHPDHGGSTAAQAVVNECYQAVKKALEGAGGGR